MSEGVQSGERLWTASTIIDGWGEECNSAEKELRGYDLVPDTNFKSFSQKTGKEKQEKGTQYNRDNYLQIRGERSQVSRAPGRLLSSPPARREPLKSSTSREKPNRQRPMLPESVKDQCDSEKHRKGEAQPCQKGQKAQCAS